MADNRLSEKFDALSDKAKESANKLKAAGGREKDQLKADAAAARERATATADQFGERVHPGQRVGQLLAGDQLVEHTRGGLADRTA